MGGGGCTLRLRKKTCRMEAYNNKLRKAHALADRKNQDLPADSQVPPQLRERKK